MTLTATILDHLRTLHGDGRTLDDLVHELTVLRRAGREMPTVKPDAVRMSLETLEAEGKVLHDTMGDQWFYAPVSEHIQQRLFL